MWKKPMPDGNVDEKWDESSPPPPPQYDAFPLVRKLPAKERELLWSWERERQT